MITINKFFDRVYYINLDRRPDRKSECEEELKKHWIEAERFSGFDHETSGHCGCSRSHRTLLRQIASDKSIKRALILEDDFQVVTLDVLKKGGFTPGSPVWKSHASIPASANLNHRFSYLARFLPRDWDVIYLGAGYGEPPISRANKHVIRCGFMQTTSSYGITREMAQKWSDRVDADMGSSDLSKHPGPIDNVFGGMAKDFNFYVFQPRLMFQRKSMSDITGESNSYLFSMTDPVAESSI